jgi:hypothetical protein
MGDHRKDFLYVTLKSGTIQKIDAGRLMFVSRSDIKEHCNIRTR